MLVDSEQVVSLSARLGKAFFEKLIEGFQVLEPPVLSGSYLTEILAQFHEALVAFVFFGLFPGQDLINLPQDQECSLAIEFGSHEGPRVNPQVRPANQGSLLLVFYRDSVLRVQDDRGKVLHKGSSGTRFAGSECRCGR